MRCWLASISLFLMLFSIPVWAQQYSTEVGVGGGNVTAKKYIEVETQLQQGLPHLLEKIQKTATQVKENDFEGGQVSIQQAIRELKTNQAVLSKEHYYKEIQEDVDRVGKAMDKAEQAIQKKRKKEALNQLAQAYRRTQAIVESPVLKLAATEIALGNASRQLAGKNYRGAGLFLQQAIDNLTAIQDDPYLNPEDINRLKSGIIATQQQVVMGKLEDEKRLKRFYPGLAAARVNTLNTYYDIWTRNNLPWEMY